MLVVKHSINNLYLDELGKLEEFLHFDLYSSFLDLRVVESIRGGLVQTSRDNSLVIADTIFKN